MIKKSLIDEPHDLVRYDVWEAQWEKPDTLGLHEYISEKCHPEDVLICSRLFFLSLSWLITVSYFISLTWCNLITTAKRIKFLL